MRPTKYMTDDEVRQYIEHLNDALTFMCEKDLPKKYGSAESLIFVGIEMLQERLEQSNDK